MVNKGLSIRGGGMLTSTHLIIITLIAVFFLCSIPSCTSQAITSFPDTRKTPEGFYMNNDKCFCMGIGGTCIGECGRTFGSAELTSRDEFLYGRFEARLLPSIEADGTVATFFLYKNDSDKTAGAAWQEIDYEVHGMGPHGAAPIQTNMIVGDFVNRQFSEVFLQAPGVPHTVAAQTKEVKSRFHHFAIEWTPDYIAWFFNGRRIRYEVPCNAPNPPSDAPEECSPQVDKMNSPMNLRISLWPLDPTPFWAEGWAGIFDDKADSFPMVIYFDYIKTYKYDPITKGFVFAWQDNFSELSEKTWELSAHTFDVNFATFSPENAVIVKEKKSRRRRAQATPTQISASNDVGKDRSYLAIVMQPNNVPVVPPPVPSDPTPLFDYRSIPDLRKVENNWNPPPQTFRAPEEDCVSRAEDGGFLKSGKMYQGGLLSFSKVIDIDGKKEAKMIETAAAMLPFVEDAKPEIQICAAMCFDVFDSAESPCRSFTVMPSQDATVKTEFVCSGYIVPKSSKSSDVASSGVVCRGKLIVEPSPTGEDAVVDKKPPTADKTEATETAEPTKPPPPPPPPIKPPVTTLPRAFPRLSMRLTDITLKEIETTAGKAELRKAIAESLGVLPDSIRFESFTAGSVVVEFSVDPSSAVPEGETIMDGETISKTWQQTIAKDKSPLTEKYTVDKKWPPVVPLGKDSDSTLPDGGKVEDDIKAPVVVEKEEPVVTKKPVTPAPPTIKPTAKPPPSVEEKDKDYPADAGIAPPGSALFDSATDEDGDANTPPPTEDSSESDTPPIPSFKPVGTRESETGGTRDSRQEATNTGGNSRVDDEATRQRPRQSGSANRGDSDESNNAWIYTLVIVLVLLFVGVIAAWIIIARRKLAQRQKAKQATVQQAGTEPTHLRPSATSPGTGKSAGGPV